MDLVGVVRHCDGLTSIRYLLAIILSFHSVLMQRRLAPADKKMVRISRCRFYPIADLAIDLPGAYFGGAREMYCRGVYLAQPEVQLKPGDTVVDLGANQGLFSLLAAPVAEKVVAVEAQSGMHEQFLVPRLAQHENVHFIHGLMAARSGLFSNPEARICASHWHTEPDEISFPELMRRAQIGQVDFLKCDIEGSEFALFDGGDEWLPYVQRIALEYHPKFGDVSHLAAKLKQHGFQIRFRDSNLRSTIVPSREPTGGYLYAWRI